MKIWQLTFMDSAYLKYKSKLKLPFYKINKLKKKKKKKKKMHSHLFSRHLSQDFVLTKN